MRPEIAVWRSASRGQPRSVASWISCCSTWRRSRSRGPYSLVVKNFGQRRLRSHSQGPSAGAQTAAEFELGLVEAGLQPVQDVLIHPVGQQRLSCGSGDATAGGDDLLVLLLEHRVADVVIMYPSPISAAIALAYTESPGSLTFWNATRIA
jgi:hypothetical protein